MKRARPLPRSTVLSPEYVARHTPARQRVVRRRLYPLFPGNALNRTSPLSCLVLTALLVTPLSALAHPESPTTDLTDKDAAAAVALGSSVRALAPLIRLQGNRDEVDDLNLLAQTYSTLLSRNSTHPLVRTAATSFYADIERTRGHLTKAAAILEPLGYLRRFYVVGGFDNEGKAGCDATYGPEKGLTDLTASFPGKSRETTWRPLTSTSLDGYVDLSPRVRPNTETVAYALTFLEAAAETKATLSLGVSGAFRMWVNGQKVASEDRYNLPRPDQTRVAVRLRRGVNRVMVKLCQESGPLGFYLRQERGPGPGVRAKPVFPETLPPLPAGPPPQPLVLPTATQLLEREVKQKPNDALLRGDYATVLAFSRAFELREHLDTVEAEKAVELAPTDVDLQLLAAHLQHEDHNLRRKHLEAALHAGPDHPYAQLKLASFELTSEHPERALPMLEALVKAHPTFGLARLAQVRAHQALGEWPRAVELLEATFRELPHIPSVAREAARTSRRLDRFEEAVLRTRTALGLRFDDADSRRALASLFADLARVDEAGQQLERVLQLDPFDNASRLRLAELYAANDRPDDARARFAEARQLAPDEPEVHEREGRALLQLQQRKEAIASFRRSLELRPQNPALKEVLRTLEGEDSAIGSEYAIELKPLEKEADAYAGEDAVTLADYTYVRVQPSGLSSRFQQLGVKVFSQRGVDAFRSYPITYSPGRQEVRVLRARVTKADGSVVESFGESERAMNEPWTGMYYDTRAKMLSFPQLAAGDLLEVQYRIDDTAQDNLLSDYWGNVDYVQSTSPKLRYQLFVDMPSARPLYWNRTRAGPGITYREDAEKNGRVLHRWSAQHVSKVIPEPAMPGWAEVVSTLHVSTYKTWDQVGRYYWGLVRDQLVPNAELRKTVETLLKGVNRKDEPAVIRALYTFVVMNTRYVALEFGIHGYKPYPVDRVLARRFGDCKDKASLIQAMLKVAGIDSRLVLLRMRQLGDIGEEPASLAAFNHAIAYVPKYKLFLDGTAEFHASRELPSADRSANVLVIEPGGNSTFFTTPEAKSEDNVTSLQLDVALAKDGSARTTGKSEVSGQSAPEYRRAYQAAATRKATFEQGWAQTFPGLTVRTMTMSEPTHLDENVKLAFELDVPRYAEALPHGLRFHPFGNGRAYTQAFAPLSERKQDLVLSGPWVNTFHFRYTLPAGYSVSGPAPEGKEETAFGRHRLVCAMAGATFDCEGEVTFTVARVKASEYPAFRSWLGRIDQLFSRKLFAGAASSQSASR